MAFGKFWVIAFRDLGRNRRRTIFTLIGVALGMMVLILMSGFITGIFDSILERLRYTAIRKEIYICSYGTITYDLVKLPWLQIRDPAMEHNFKLAIFTSK